MPGLLKTRQRSVFIIFDIITAIITPSIIFLFLLIIISKPHWHLAQNQQRWGFNHHSNTTDLEPSDMSTLVCREVRGVSVWRSVYSNVVLRSSPIWMKTCGCLLFGRNLCGSRLRGRSRRCGWRCFLEKQSMLLWGRERGVWMIFGDRR